MFSRWVPGQDGGPSPGRGFLVSSLPSCLRLKGPWPPQRVDLIGQQIYLTHQEPSKGRDQPRLSSRSGRGDRTHCQANSSLEATPRGEGRRGQRQQGGSGGRLRHAHRAPCAEPGSWAWDSCRHTRFNPLLSPSWKFLITFERGPCLHLALGSASSIARPSHASPRCKFCSQAQPRITPVT